MLLEWGNLRKQAIPKGPLKLKELMRHRLLGCTFMRAANQFYGRGRAVPYIKEGKYIVNGFSVVIGVPWPRWSLRYVTNYIDQTIHTDQWEEAWLCLSHTISKQMYHWYSTGYAGSFYSWDALDLILSYMAIWMCLSQTATTPDILNLINSCHSEVIAWGVTVSNRQQAVQNLYSLS